MKPIIPFLIVLLSVNAAAGEPDPTTLSPMARQFLRRRMASHRDDMTKLVLAVALLQRAQARALANDIANEPRIARPIAGGDADLNAELPSRFFALQDELRARAKDLVQAVETRSDAEVGAAFGRLTGTCVACHSAFLEPVPTTPKRPAPAP